jgi:1,4-alpha-glucan branching enzyme
MLTSQDLHLWNEGRWLRAWEKMGARAELRDGVAGFSFAVWAPNAARVSVVGQFNGWDGRANPCAPVETSGIWATFIPGLGLNEIYKFEIQARDGSVFLKSDPFGLATERPPETASVTARFDTYKWRDADWIETRRDAGTRLDRPVAIYEVHAGSWRHAPAAGNAAPRALNWRELARDLVPYLVETGFTHVELLPVMEHPYEPSWGYQVTGFFAPTSRFGPPDDFRFFVDECHQAGIGVLLDWVPGHFPKDAHGLRRFDGTALFEHEDPRQGEHQDWGTLVFNYGRNEVRNFLISNALYWLESFHIDGLRVDAVASMLYLDYSRDDGAWVPNRFGGRENLEAIDFLRELNAATHEEQPGTVMIAEESTAFPAVSRPTWVGGLGFTFKWNMGWMHDILTYAAKDPVFRRWEHRHLTFSMLYAFNENFVLPFSHDEVVHGKGSMLTKMSGDAWQKAATLRALYAFMYAHPGKKLMFMGCEFGQWREWTHEQSLDWHLLDGGYHSEILSFVTDLNHLYQREPALYEVDFEAPGFEWIDCNDSDASVVSLVRRARASDTAGATNPDELIAIVNWTPVVRENYRIGVPSAGYYAELLNSDASAYGGSNVGNQGGLSTEDVPAHGRAQSLNLTLPPLGALFFKKRVEPTP